MSTRSAIDGSGYRRILVALDGSPLAEEALPQAVAQAHAFSAALILVQVVPTLLTLRPPAVITSESDSDPAETNDERAAQRYLEAVAENMRRYGIETTWQVRRGPTVPTILTMIEETLADLIVLTARGAGLLPRSVVGSVASQIVARASCPVLLVRANITEPLSGDDRIRSFDADAARYGPLVQRPLGHRTVEIERIVGSVGRAREVSSSFMPYSNPQGDTRYKRILAALERDEILPPIELYKLGYDYYVLDGNHRVAAARTRGQKEIDAIVIEFLPIDNADAHRVYLERRAFEAAVGLPRIGATRPGHYPRLLEMIEQYAAEHDLHDLEEAAQRWHTQIYRPLASKLRAARLTRLFPGERTADLAVHVADLRDEEQRAHGRTVSLDEALELMLSRYRSCYRHARRRFPGLSQILGTVRHTPEE